MANIKSAKKRIKTNERDRQKNMAGRSKIKTLIKKLDSQQEEKTIRETVNIIYSALDKAETKKIFHKNKVARLKSLIAQRAKRMVLKLK